MAERKWQPAEGWAGAGEYRGLGETCPRCGSNDIKWAIAVRTKEETTTAGECLSCGLTFRAVARTEVIDEGGYDADTITIVNQDGINE